MDVFSPGFTSMIGPLISLAIERLKYSHMYTTMGLLGILVSIQKSTPTVVQLLSVLPITIVTTGLYILNDVYDIEIDRISHANRALPRGDVSEKAATVAGILLILAGTLVALYLDWLSGVFVGTIGIFGGLYSVPPIRLRRFPVVPSVIIGFFVFLSFLAGYLFFGDMISSEILFGAMLLWAMFIGCSLAKDLGDVEGDRKAGVSTLPTILGFHKAFRITSFLVYGAYLFPILFILLLDFPLFLVIPILVLLSIEIIVLEKFGKEYPSPDSDKLHGMGFAPFVGVQITLIIGALL